ncbi:uncharacterized protein LOC128988024 [Macrosteles quadrilineatus]|uniref:uncharacterized protein LOC128988024 n=1 Tax=Macrosteles quadrilineatus TaxID=74068 RepID=UPI0023E163EA|nr:uncharacterized protein LOC128988024 [Macrosteles quadrilineatus]
MARLLCVLLLLVPICLAKSPLRALGQYYLNWDGGMRPCEGFDNSIFDLSKLVVVKRSKTLLALAGDVKMLKETSNKLKFKLTIHKEVNGNYEYLMTVTEDDLCKHISEEKKPWTPIIKEMEIKGCPIPAKMYSFKSSTLDVAGYPLTVGQAGHYKAQMELFDSDVRTVCMLMETNVQPL